MKPDTPFPPGSLILPYLRDSGGREQNVSVDRQRAEITAWASANQLIVPRWYFDPARSGRSTAGREHFLKLIDYLTSEPRPENGIVFWEYARLARDFDDTMYYLAELRRMGYVAWSVTDAIPDTLEGRLLESIITWKNAKYLQDLSRAVRSGLHYVVKVHQAYPNRKPPIGYKRDPLELPPRRDGRPHIVNRLIPDPDTAPVILKAFSLRAEGATYAEIHNALRLTASHISLSRILCDPIYIGTLQFGDKEYPGFCPPIVPREIWNAAQRINTARRLRHGYNHPRSTRSRFILTGLLCCAECGAPMHGRTVKQKSYRSYDYYRCRNSANGKAASCHTPLIPKDELEKMVLDTLEASVLKPEILTPLLHQARSSLSGKLQEHQAELAHLERQAGEAEQSIQNILKAISESGHSRAMLEKLTELESRRDGISAAIAARADSAPQPVEINPAELEKTVAVLIRKLRGKPSESLTVLRGLVVEIKAKRKSGGSHIANRSMPITVNITFRLPLTNATGTISV